MPIPKHPDEIDDDDQASEDFLAGWKDADTDGERIEPEQNKGDEPKDAKTEKGSDGKKPSGKSSAADKKSAPEDTDPATVAKEPEEPEIDPELDPFAQSPIVQKILARQTELEHELRTVKGRNSAMQGELTKLRKQTPSPSPTTAPAAAAAVTPATDAAQKPKNPERERVRGELPEVAAAMDEQDAALQELRETLNQQRPEPPAPAPATKTETPEDREARELAALDPQWAQKMNSDAFKLWLSTQPEKYRDDVLSTDRALIVAGALKKFDGFMESRVPVVAIEQGHDPATQRRTNRMERAVAPAGNVKPTGLKKPMTEREAMLWAFEHPDQAPP